jgi:hypothetical protein
MKHFSTHSKIWIYFSSAPITGDKKDFISSKLEHFCQEWTAHNKQLKSSFDIVDEHFIVLCVDESQNTATGCSIDKSVHVLKEISSFLDVNLFDRMLLPFHNGNGVEYCHFQDISELYKNKSINDETVFYDLSINFLSDLQTDFKLPLKQHWLSKHLN